MTTLPVTVQRKWTEPPAPDGAGQQPGVAPAMGSDGVPTVAPHAAPHPVEAARDPYRMAHQALRGRYWLAATLGVVTAIGGAMAGRMLGHPIYRAEGLVRVAYVKPAVMRETDQNAPIASYEMYMRSEQQVMSSTKVIGLALKSPAWQATGRGDSAAVLDDLASEIKVERNVGTEHLRVLYEDRQPEIAAAGVNAVLWAYSNLYTTGEQKVRDQRMDALQKKRSDYQAQVAELERQIERASRDATGASIEQRHAAAKARVGRFDTILVEMRLGQLLQGGAAVAPGAGDAPKAAVPGDGRAAAAKRGSMVVMPSVRSLYAARLRLQEQLEELQLRGLAERHPDVIRLTKQLDRMDERIQEALSNPSAASQDGGEGAAAAAAMAAQGAPGATGAAATDVLGRMMLKSPDEIRADEEALSKLFEQAVKDLSKLEADVQKLTMLRGQVDVLRKEIAAATERIETLETESPLGSRMEISVDAGVPTAPFRDTRIKTAAAGAVAGGMVPLSLLLAFGLCRRRYRYADEAESDFTRVVPMLGVIPDLLDRQTGADAAHCVHRVRAVLQARAAGHQPRAYLLTSAVAGEGKTSFTSALGLSFAAAGCRTLVIDCDLVGRRLTQCFNARDGRGLVAVLAGAGLIGLAVQRGEGLWVLPAGTETGGESSAISAPAIRRLLAEAKAHFDVVLMDTGPVLGSVEALVAASECDGAILVVARGQDPNLVRRAMKNLESVHGKTLGFVFNRAHYGDFRGSTSASSQRSVAAEAPAWRSRAPRFVPVDGAAHPSFSDMAPLAQAVASNAGGSGNSGTAA